MRLCFKTSCRGCTTSVPRSLVEDPLAGEVLAGNVTEGDHVVIDHLGDDEKLSFRVEPGERPTESDAAIEEPATAET